MRFTARIQRMTEGNLFTLSTIAGGGVPHLADWGGGPHPVLTEGYPHPSWQGGTPSGWFGGGTPSQVRKGEGGLPCQDWMGVIHPIGTGLGTPHSGLDGVPPCWDWMWVLPHPHPLGLDGGSRHWDLTGVWMGVPPVERSGDRAATRWVVCLLR